MTISPHSKIVQLLVGLLLAGMMASFAWQHLVAYNRTGALVYLMMILAETLCVSFFATRIAPKSMSANPFDWFAAVAGTFVNLLYVPSSWGVLPAGKFLVFAGVALEILGLLSLNRSLALVAAHRVLKTKYMYAIIRHPLYVA